MRAILSRTFFSIGAFLALASFPFFAMAEAKNDANSEDLPSEQTYSRAKASQRVQSLLESLTIEEKIGQMTQITVGILREDTPDGGRRFNPAKLKEAIETYHVGSILNNDGKPMSSTQWRKFIGEINAATEKSRSKIPVIYGIDSIHGAGFIKDTTIFPHNIGLASARNVSLVTDIAKATAMQTRAAGIRWNFDTVLDMGRDPLWPRFEETFGEDTHIVTEMGVAAYQGYNTSGLDDVHSVASSMKHFVGYGEPFNGKDRVPSYIPTKQLWETHIPPFEAAINAGAPTLMVNSGTLNGVAVHADQHLLEGIVRQQLGFTGVIVSDWEDIIRLHTRHRVADTPKEAVAQGIEAGIDMSMVPENYSFFTYLKALVQEGRISEERIDQSVIRILTLKEKLGLLDDATPEKEAAKNAYRSEYNNLALEAAEASMVLLKNTHNALPLQKNDRILLAGPGADSRTALSGSWSYTWQGDDETAYPDTFQSIADAMIVRMKKAGEEYANTFRMLSKRSFSDAANTDARIFKQDLSDIDKIILVLGEDAYAETPGNIHDLNLPQEQLDFALAAIQTGKPVIVVLTQGRPRIIRSIEPALKGILLAHRPGTFGAQAIVNTLYGDHNPSGKLAYSYPRFSGDILPYDHEYSAAMGSSINPNAKQHVYNPQWSFGFGISYTDFIYSDIKVNKKRFQRDESITVSVSLKNTGDMAGAEVVDVFITDHYAKESPAVKRLKAFSQQALGKGKKTRLSFTLDLDDFSYVRRDLKRVVEPGLFTIQIGSEEVEVEFMGETAVINATQ